MYVYRCMCVCLYVYRCMYVCMQVGNCVCMYVCMQVNVCVCMCVCVYYVCVYTEIKLIISIKILGLGKC